MHGITTKAISEHEMQAVMENKHRTSALPVVKPDRQMYSMFDTNQRAWLDEMLKASKRQQIGRLISRAILGVPEYMPDPQGGSYNLTHIMNFVSGRHAVLRQVNLGTSMFPNEKTTNEVSVMRLIAEKTTIPVACIHYAKLIGDLCEKGTEDLDTDDLRPFIIMDYLPHDRDMGKALNTPEHSDEELQILNPELDPTELKNLYRLAANALLDLSRLDFEAIGSPKLIEDTSWKVTRRPLTRRMNDLVSIGGCRQDDLPQFIFTSTSKYFVALAQLHIDHLTRQPKDAFGDELDCMQKYVARLLFRKMMSERVPSQLDEGPFKLWCDDFRPRNILLSDDDIAGVIDWEFTYAASAEFSYAPPWWLLLQRPEDWELGWSDWNEKYGIVLVTFLEAMAEVENAINASGRLAEEHRLSQKMRESWENGDFWVMYCLQTDYAFDLIFWKGIFPRQYRLCADFEAEWKSAWSLLNEKDKLEAQRFAAESTSRR
ncbi:hypothetical protein PWT90_08137 [Aphanocladium album]|nr:hypothetical protein PWT90_08137 [Aphanocladium album]